MVNKWVELAKAGDPKAWDLLYRQHYPWLFALALNICGNTPAAKDLVQETFIQAYLKLHQLKDPSAFPCWLKTILLRSGYKKPTGKILFGDHYIKESDRKWEDDMSRQLDGCDLRMNVHHVLASMSETLRTVTLLRYFSAWSKYEQIAEILCIPVGTVRSRLNQAREKMAERWTPETGYDERPLKQASEWNELYSSYFGQVHSSASFRQKLIDHLDKDLQLVFTSGKSAHGRKVIESEIEGDLIYGNRFSDLSVSSSGNISIVELENTNSPEFPGRCPRSSILVLYRSRDQLNKIHLHNSH